LAEDNVIAVIIRLSFLAHAVHDDDDGGGDNDEDENVDDCNTLISAVTLVNVTSVLLLTSHPYNSILNAGKYKYFGCIAIFLACTARQRR